MSAVATMPRAMSAEWIKLRSVRSTRWTLLAFVTVSIGIGTLIAFAVSQQWATMDPREKVGFEATQASLQGIILGQLVIAVLGVLAVTAEYSSGTIRATLAAVPQRLTVLSAKTAVFAAVAVVASAITCAVAFFTAQAVLHSTGVSATIGQRGVLAAIGGGVLYLVLVGLLALGIGTLVRSTAAGITAVVGLIFVLPLLANFLPGHWSTTVGKWMPMSLGQSLTSLTHDATSLSAGASAVMMAGYAAVALIAGGIMLVRRDA